MPDSGTAKPRFVRLPPARGPASGGRVTRARKADSPSARGRAAKRKRRGSVHPHEAHERLGLVHRPGHRTPSRLSLLVVAWALVACGGSPDSFRSQASQICRHELGPLNVKRGPNTSVKEALALARTWDERVLRTATAIGKLRSRPPRTATWLAATRAAVRASRTEDRTPLFPVGRYHRAERRTDAATARANRMAAALGLRDCRI